MFIFENIIFKHLSKVIYILLSSIFHFEISGKHDNELKQSNISVILVALLLFHFEISGKNDN